MRISRLYLDVELKQNITLQLDKITANYVLRVLRLTAGAQLIIFNGRGGAYHATLLNQNKQPDVLLGDYIDDERESNLNITLYQGVSKSDRMDLTIQKAVELGVTDIQPLICQRTVVNLKAERLEKKMKHWRGIITSASEQCGRNTLLTIYTPRKYIDVIQTEILGRQFVLSPEAEQTFTAFDIKEENAISLLIGPEGGLDATENQLALDHGFTAVRMGSRILRTETAAIAAMSVIQTLWGDLG